MSKIISTYKTVINFKKEEKVLFYQYIDTKSVHQSDVQTTGVNLFMIQSVDLICKFNTRKKADFIHCLNFVTFITETKLWKIVFVRCNPYCFHY